MLRRLKAAGIDVATLTGESLEDAEVAAMHECVAILCITMPQILRQTEIEVDVSVQEIDWEKSRAFHLGESGEKIAQIIADNKPQKQLTGRKLPMGAVGTERPDPGDSASYRTRRVSFYEGGS